MNVAEFERKAATTRRRRAPSRPAAVSVNSESQDLSAKIAETKILT
jgi:hypothetical protein